MNDNGNTILLDSTKHRTVHDFLKKETYKTNGSGNIQDQTTAVSKRLSVHIVGNDIDGYVYVNEKGEAQKNYCDGITKNGTDWIIICENATRVKNESEKTIFWLVRMWQNGQPQQ